MNRKFTVTCDADRIDEMFKDISPFKLQKILQEINEKYSVNCQQIEEFCADELLNAIKPPKRSLLYNSGKIQLLKIRMPDKTNSRGSSYGFRIIILRDNCNYIGIVLCIYHKIDKKDLTSKELKKLKELTNEYAKSTKEN